MAYTEQYVAKLTDELDSALDGLDELSITTITSGQSQQDERVKNYLLHGVGRRLNLMRRCLRTVFQLFPPETTRPLCTDDLHEVQINLHAFVMNLYGVFENLAWAFVARHKLENTIGGRNNVGLFLRTTQQYLPLPLNAYLTSPTIADWHNDYLKNYRDALAHRIPLYIPPARYTDEEAARDRALDAKEHDCIVSQQWDELERVRNERKDLGSALPVFLHSFTGGDRVRPVHLHPQLICDVKTILEFGPLYFAHWHERAVPDLTASAARPRQSIQDFEDEATLFSLSGEYLEAAQMLRDTLPLRIKVDVVTYYLAGHAAELVLKSFLHKNGDSIHDLRTKFGHDISKLIERAKSKGLPDSVSVKCMLSFAYVYSNKKTEYRSGSATFPLIDDLLGEVRALKAHVFNHVATFGNENETGDNYSDPNDR